MDLEHLKDLEHLAFVDKLSWQKIMEVLLVAADIFWSFSRVKKLKTKYVKVTLQAFKKNTPEKLWVVKRTGFGEL